jgi:nucleotide-binding universal stress UspA family protein
MKRFKNLLLLDPGPDGRNVALNRALALAKANEARLTVAGPAEEVPDEIAEIVRRTTSKDLDAAAHEAEREALEQWVGNLPADAPPVTIEVLERDSYVEILQQVERGGHDLLMLTAEGEIGGWFGSTATHLLRKSAVPVWVMKHHPQPRYRSVLIALDRDLSDTTGEQLNIKLLELGASLAAAEGSELHIGHAWTIYAESVLRNRLGASGAQMEKIAEETLRSREQWMDALLARVPAAKDAANVNFARGEPHKAVPRLVEDLGVDLIVMGTLGRSGMFGGLIGDTAERILNRVQCAVLAVKPDGFKSPVRLPAV